jgi:O-antigen ligase
MLQPPEFPNMLPEIISLSLLRISLIGIALCIPFSIAGANISIGIGILGMLIAAATASGRKTLFARMRRDPILLASILLVGTALVSALLSENMHRGVRDWSSYWLFSIYLLVGFGAYARSFRRLLFWILFASGSLSAAIALVQASGGLKFLFVDIADTVRPSSTLYITTFAGVLYQLVCVNFSTAFEKPRSRITAGIMILGLAIQIVALMFNLSRAAMFALVLGFATVALLLRKGAVTAVASGTIAVMLVLTIMSPTLHSRLKFAENGGAFHQDKSINTRFVLWDISLDLIREHPLFGVGMGDFSLEADRRLHGRFVKTTTDAHNIYLHVLATRGLFGFIPFVLFWVILLRQLRTLERRSKSRGDAFSRHLITGVIAATVAVLVGALTENNIDDSEVFIAFLFLLGLARGTEWDDGTAGESASNG